MRVDDYIQAYTTTGRPPQPVPQLPIGDKERSALGLPPLFKPTPENDPVLVGRPKEPTSLSQVVGGRKKDPEDIPATQDFKSERVGGETFYTISCSEPYSWFSLEVRVRATPIDLDASKKSLLLLTVSFKGTPSLRV